MYLDGDEACASFAAGGLGAPTIARPTSFTAVICAYTLDRWEDLAAALASLGRQTCPPHEVILVTDHNPELLARAAEAFPAVRCVANEGLRGLSSARNTGVRHATGDVVGFLDDDAAAAPDWVERLLAAYEDENVLGVGGWVLPAWRAPRPSWFPEEFLWVIGCSYAGLPDERAQVRNPIGANMSFRRDVLLALGGFDDGVGRLGADAAGCEETELAIRARMTLPDGRILLEPSAVCDHNVDAERLTRRYFRRRCAAEGRSKALVSTIASTDEALSSERSYVSRTLPAAFVRELGNAVRGDLSGIARAWALVEGTCLTASSYLAMACRLRWRPESSTQPT